MENASKHEAAAPTSETKQRARELHVPEKDDAVNEQPRKRAKREDQTKCSKCNKRLARRACSQAACISCCSDVACEVHTEAREAAQWKEDVLKGTTDVQQQAKAKRAMAVIPGSFRESGFLFLNQTITIWNRQEFMSNKKWREDAVRRADKRQARRSMSRTVKPIRNSIQRFRRKMNELYQKSLKQESTLDKAIEEAKKSVTSIGNGNQEEESQNETAK
eukprot:CAMPEP_0202496368 /NCGR_PEP_ID=MMETSP1361-20130828/19616_1 /ASSEMBLY_ACC=CAM_ASM_000849 /TAXON_ID=210615 /ORGANISM="Staurosira complex sp., Strain CCMP2646" /LENGTH=218 /DNA_ID=CAMNT_0049127681 /DNA_START=100 /DNA_END=756 /DNA_ORIENTATION=+